MLHVADLCHTATVTVTATEPGRRKTGEANLGELAPGGRTGRPVGGHWSVIIAYLCKSRSRAASGRMVAAFLLETAKTCVRSITFTHRPC